MKNKILRFFYFIWKRSSERSKRRYFKKKYQKEIEFFKNYADKKDPSTIKREIRLLKKYWHEYPVHYFVYGLYRKNIKLTDQAIKNYIPLFFAKYILYPNSYKAYLPLVAEKSLSKTMFSSFHIPTTPTLFEIHDGKFYLANRKRIDADFVLNNIISKQDEKIFIKPNEGSEGKGIVVLAKNGDGKYYDVADHKILDIAYLENLKKIGNYIAEEGIQQHPAVSSIHSDSVNTIRFFTEYRAGKIFIHLAIMRFGANKSHVDNAHSGGMFCNVDLESGKINACALDLQFKEYAQHPTSGVVFDGFQIPFWQETCDMIRKSVFKLRQIKYLGWDVAITPDGPLVIEVNGNPDPAMSQIAHGPLKEKLNIGKPDSCYHSSSYKLKAL